MAFGIYVHIPHCLQLCHYCDFATVKRNNPSEIDAYTQIVLEEIRSRNRSLQNRKVSTLYFGGGTPSLAGPANIGAVIQELRGVFDLSELEEVTLEINPGTLTQEQLDQYRELGITRYSVGVQTFDDHQLKYLGREHSALQTRQTLDLLKFNGVHFTADLLFALPHQSLSQLEADLKIFKEYRPEHVSAYILTLPEKFPLNANRPSDELQVEMFYTVERHLSEVGLTRYEISNFCLPGHESKHNSLYWKDQPYWGVGMSAHSYLKSPGYGVRFWNPPTIAAYSKQINELSASKNFISDLPTSRRELLTVTQSLTDFVHTGLRMMAGLDLTALEQKYDVNLRSQVTQRLLGLQDKGLVTKTAPEKYAISHSGLVLSDQVFQEMTFIPSDLD